MTKPDQGGNILGKMKRRGGSAAKIVRFVVVLAVLGTAIFFAWTLLGREPQKRTPTSAAPVPAVELGTVQSADIADSREYVGQVEAIQSVSLTPEVSARILQVHFEEGSMVKAGDLLFTLDASRYQATVNQQKANLVKAKADLDGATKYYNRLMSAEKRSVAATDIDTAFSTVQQDKAAVGEMQAALELAMVDLGHTKIVAPISGRIGRAYFTKGNYVTPTSGSLADIVQTDPVRVSFALPDRDYLSRPNAFDAGGQSVYRAKLLLADGQTYPFDGTRDYANNTMDPTTGTIMTRFRFRNETGLLVPGSLVRITIRTIQGNDTPVVPQKAIVPDGDTNYVYAVDAKNVVHRRDVTIGAESGDMYAITAGLKVGEKIVVGGLQMVHPEMTVRPLPASSASPDSVVLPGKVK